MGTGAGGSPARELLGPDHGAPFRVILPQWYAVASVKWLKRIDVLTEACTGEFQAGHYMDEWPDRPAEPVDVMRVRARITDRAPGATIDAGTYTVRGKAWSGSGRTTTVEVSLTGAGDWEPAQLEAAPPSGRTVRTPGRRPVWVDTRSGHAPPTRPAACNLNAFADRMTAAEERRSRPARARGIGV